MPRFLLRGVHQLLGAGADRGHCVTLSASLNRSRAAVALELANAAPDRRRRETCLRLHREWIALAARVEGAAIAA